LGFCFFFQGTSLNLASGLVHFWLRLLVTYHSPKLAQHLDRVVPGWEKASTEISTAQVILFAYLYTKIPYHLYLGCETK
jgi:hypothetical protein